MINVLWLPSWYPTTQSVQNGDFIRRHALAASQHNNLSLLYVQSVDDNKIYKSPEVILSSNENFTETIVIYKKSGISIVNRLVSIFKYFLYSKREIRRIIGSHNFIDIVHVHVTFRAGLLALWIKKKYNIPFVVSEHWGIFTPERNENFLKRNLIFKYLVRKVIKEASALTVVSDSLGKGIQEMVIQRPFIKIPNVVDVKAFNYKEPDNSLEFVFTHVSGMKSIKNPEGIINAFKRLLQVNNNVKLVMIGSAPKEITNYAWSNGLKREQIIFKGVLEYEIVAKEFQHSNAFILFSNSETQSCVTIEALCCGVPVIASKLPCIEELIDDQNGILIPPGDEDALFNAMKRMLNEAEHYDHKAIADKAQSLYNPSVIGQQFNAVYEKVLSERRDYK